MSASAMQHRQLHRRSRITGVACLFLTVALLLGGLFWMVLRYGLRALKIFLSGKFKKNKTRPAPTEPAAPAQAS